MKKIKLCTLAILISSFASCSDSPVIPQKVTVSGSLEFEYGYADNYKVEINGNIAPSDINGKFTIPDVEIPYDLNIMSPDSNIFIYKGLTSSSPVINVSGQQAINFQNSFSANVTVISSEISSPQRAKIFFVPDEEDIEVFGSFFGNISGSGSMSPLYWDKYNSITGKLCILIYTRSMVRITSYDRFYEIDNITLSNNISKTINLDSGYSYSDPGEKIVSGTISTSFSGSPITIMVNSYYSNFVEYSPFNILEDFQVQNSYSLLVPQVLPEYFSMEVRADIFGSPYEFSSGRKSVFPQNNSDPIYVYKPVSYTLPEQNGIINLYGGRFSWDAGDGTGIYELGMGLQTDGKQIKVYTASTSTSVPDLSAMGFTYIGNGQHVIYNVTKHYGFYDMNSFVRENYKKSDLNKGYSYSNYIDITVN